MHRISGLFYLFLVAQGVLGVLHVIDLNNHKQYKNYKEIKLMSSFSSYLVSFEDDDSLDLFVGNKFVWSSNENHRMVNLLLLEKYDLVQLCHIMLRDRLTGGHFNIYLYRAEDHFTEISRTFYYELAAILRENVKPLNIREISKSWVTTVQNESDKIHYVEHGVIVSKVLDGNLTIWENPEKWNVEAVKIVYENGCKEVEIYVVDKVFEKIMTYIYENGRWIFKQMHKHPIEERKLKPKPAPTQSQPRPKEPVRNRTLFITMEDKDVNLPLGASVGEYKICGFDTKIYNTRSALVSKVVEDEVVLCKIGRNGYLKRVLIYKSPLFDSILCEFQYSVRRKFDLGPVKGLENKEHNNIYQNGYGYFIKSNGIWENKEKLEFIKIRKEMIEKYIERNPDKHFDDSFRNFYEHVPSVEPDRLTLRKELNFGSFRSLLSTVVQNIIGFQAVQFDIDEDPRIYFNVTHKLENKSLIELTPKVEYIIFKVTWRDQTIWSQTENGSGCKKIVLVKSKNELLHLVLDESEQNKFYEKINNYWYELEMEEYVKLLETSTRLSRGTRIVYRNGCEIIISSETSV